MVSVLAASQEASCRKFEAQPVLALETARLRGSGAAGAANLDLASEILDGGLYYGDSEPEVAALDAAYSAPSGDAPARQPQPQPAAR